MTWQGGEGRGWCVFTHCGSGHRLSSYLCTYLLLPFAPQILVQEISAFPMNIASVSILCYVGLEFRKWGSPKSLAFSPCQFHYWAFAALVCKCMPVWVAEKGMCGKGRNAFLCRFSGSSSSLVPASSMPFRDIPLCVSLAVAFPGKPLGIPSDSIVPRAYRRPEATC